MTEIVDNPRARAVVLLAGGLSAEAAGARIGVNGRTLRRWRENPEFEAEIQRARRTLLDEAVGAMLPAVRDAVAALHQALDDESPVVRVRAASELIRTLPLLADHAALEGRIAALEDRLTVKEIPSWQVT